MENLQELALEILEVACETDEVREDPEMDLFETGLMDSLTVVVVILEIEKKTGVKLQPTDIAREDISTVNHFMKFLEARVK